MILVRGPRQDWRAGRLSTYGFSADSIVAAGASPDASPSAPARGLRHDRRGPSNGGPNLPMLGSSGTGSADCAGRSTPRRNPALDASGPSATRP
jgi:hypothetical protein